MDKLRNDHHQFVKGELENIDEKANPFLLFQNWLNRAVANNIHEANAFNLSTCFQNQPSTRTVYLKDFWKEGLVFYTNYNSQKAQEISNNKKVSVHFFWKELEQQIRIEGIAEKTPASMSDDYFASRPRDSKIGAWASQQSEKLMSKKTIEEKIQVFNLKYPTDAIPRPENWGGFVIFPHLYEFWQGRPNRLHDRVCFQKNETQQWDVFRKNP